MRFLSPAFIGSLFLVTLSDVLDEMPGDAPEDKLEGLLKQPGPAQDAVWQIAEDRLVQALDELVPLQEPWEAISDLAITAVVHAVIGKVDTPAEREALLDRLREAGSRTEAGWRSMSARHKRAKKARANRAVAA